MKRPNITSGPWKIGTNPGEVHWTENGRKRIVDNSYWAGESDRALYPEAERVANAQAIAALPDLLDALEEMAVHTHAMTLHGFAVEKRKELATTMNARIKTALTKAGYTF